MTGPVIRRLYSQALNARLTRLLNGEVADLSQESVRRHLMADEMLAPHVDDALVDDVLSFASNPSNDHPAIPRLRDHFADLDAAEAEEFASRVSDSITDFRGRTSTPVRERVYRGTPGSIADDQGRSFGPGYRFYSTNQDVADYFRRGRGDLQEVEVAFDRPLVIDAKGSDYKSIPTDDLPDEFRQLLEIGDGIESDHLVEVAKNNGFDGVIIRNIREGGIGDAPLPLGDDFITLDNSAIIGDPKKIAGIVSTLGASGAIAAVGGQPAEASDTEPASSGLGGFFADLATNELAHAQAIQDGAFEIADRYGQAREGARAPDGGWRDRLGNALEGAGDRVSGALADSHDASRSLHPHVQGGIAAARFLTDGLGGLAGNAVRDPLGPDGAIAASSTVFPAARNAKSALNGARGAAPRAIRGVRDMVRNLAPPTAPQGLVANRAASRGRRRLARSQGGSPSGGVIAPLPPAPRAPTPRQGPVNETIARAIEPLGRNAPQVQQAAQNAMATARARQFQEALTPTRSLPRSQRTMTPRVIEEASTTQRIPEGVLTPADYPLRGVQTRYRPGTPDERARSEIPALIDNQADAYRGRMADRVGRMTDAGHPQQAVRLAESFAERRPNVAGPPAVARSQTPTSPMMAAQEPVREAMRGVARDRARVVQEGGVALGGLAGVGGLGMYLGDQAGDNKRAMEEAATAPGERVLAFGETLDPYSPVQYRNQPDEVPLRADEPGAPVPFNPSAPPTNQPRSAAPPIELPRGSSGPQAGDNSFALGLGRLEPPGDIGDIPANPLIGEDNTSITALQQQLKRAGLYDGPIDGLRGPQTEQALSQLSELWGETLSDDDQAMDRASRSVNPDADWSRVQEIIDAAGIDVGPIDGRPGPLTLAGLNEARRRRGLSALTQARYDAIKDDPSQVITELLGGRVAR